METADVEQRIREIAERVVAEHGLEFVHAEVGVLGRSAAVRVFIDKPGGVTHEDCSTVSHHLGVDEFQPVFGDDALGDLANALLDLGRFHRAPCHPLSSKT